MELSKKILKSNFLFLIIFIPIMIYTFYPIVNIDFMDWDWLEIEYPYHVIPRIMPHFVFYLITPYGTAYALLGLAHLFFGSEMLPYYILNVLLRAVAAFAIYLFANWWSKEKIIGIIAGLFFGVSIIGIENTSWVIQFPAYVGPILLCISLYFWKRFHDSPSKESLKQSVIASAAAFFISHIRIYGLPAVLMVAEIYNFIIRIQKKYLDLKIKHVLLLLAVFFLPFLISYLILKLTNNLGVTANVFQITSPNILIQALINGHPPILITFFMFIGFLVFPPFFYPGPGSFDHPATEAVITIISLILVGFSMCFLLINLIRKRFLIALASILAVVYPISFYLTQNKLQTLEPASFISTLVGGTLFILIVLVILIIWNSKRKIGELGLLALAILIIHLLLPWASFPIPQNNIQSASDPRSRYYLIPVLGISIIWGVILNASLRSVTSYWQTHKSFIKKLLFPGNYITTSLMVFILYLLTMHIWVTHNFLVGRSSYSYKERLEELWKIVKPNFEPILDKQLERVVYFEGNLTSKDIDIIQNYIKHKLTVIGFHTSYSAHTVFFTSSKKAAFALIHQEPGSLAILGLSQPFSLDNFLAFRFEKDRLVGIREKIINEAYGKN